MQLGPRNCRCNSGNNQMTKYDIIGAKENGLDSAGVYLYDDEAKEYYSIQPDSRRSDPQGNPWFKIR